MNARASRTVRRLIGAAAATVTGLAVALSGAAPAAAGTCTTRGCGGTVRNATTGSVRVFVVNCWHDTSGSYTGSIPPCATNGYTAGKKSAWYSITPGTDSQSISKYYYDVDAVMAQASCVTTGYTRNGLSINIDRRGKSDYWMRVYGTDVAFITSVRC